MRLDYLAALCGVLIALQGRANGELSKYLHSSIQAALVSFITGLIAVAAISIFHPEIKEGLRKLRTALKTKELPWWGIIGGMLGGTFISLQSLLVPVVGVAVMSVGYIAGQTAMSLVIDRIGLTGGGKKSISIRRIFAAGLTIVSVIVAVWDKLDKSNLSLLTAILTIVSGLIVAVHRALNGRVNEITSQSFTTSLVNFVMGSIYLIVLFLVISLLGFTKWGSLPSGPWWIYTGGILGVLYIAFAAEVVQHIGVFHFTLFSVGGQLVGSLLLDFFAPTTNVGISNYLISGIVLTYIGVIASGASNSRARK